ncbi:MAG: LysE family translocator [Burkholderiales bacterium]|nr:LysE family translocator [Burkholderiales bacterium]
MSTHAFFSANLLLAYAAYFIGTASPGPSNLAIMSIAATQGRHAALAFAFGVISGSMFWATVATVGIATALLAYSQFLVAIKIFGGVYLLWLAFKSGRAALGRTALASAASASSKADRPLALRSLYVRGALLHLTNPKAVLVWASIVALSSDQASRSHGAVIAGCAAIGAVVFCSYAVVFSMDTARRFYTRTRRALDGCLAVVFGLAGIRLLAGSSK